MEHKSQEFNDQVQEALVIIYNSIKIGRPLFEFKRWDQLDYDARMEALTNKIWIRDAVKSKTSLEDAREMLSVTYIETI